MIDLIWLPYTDAVVALGAAILGVTAGVLGVALGFRALEVTLFDTSFAGSIGLPVRALEVAMTALIVVAVIVGVRAVGAILMVALLIVPTVAARQLTGRLGPMLVLAGVIGAAVGVTGSLVSMRAEGADRAGHRPRARCSARPARRPRARPAPALLSRLLLIALGGFFGWLVFFGLYLRGVLAYSPIEAGPGQELLAAPRGMASANTSRSGARARV